MIEGTRLWVTTAADTPAPLEMLESLVGSNGLGFANYVVAPWNARIMPQLPPGGVADTDWGIGANTKRSIRWRRDGSQLAFSLVSTEPIGEIEMFEMKAFEEPAVEYLVDPRFARDTGIGRIREIRYTSSTAAIVRYVLLTGGDG